MKPQDKFGIVPQRPTYYFLKLCSLSGAHLGGSSAPHVTAGAGIFIYLFTFSFIYLYIYLRLIYLFEKEHVIEQGEGQRKRENLK